MQSNILEQIRTVDFVGSGDPTIWLEDSNGNQNPLIVPLWPPDYPNRLAVYMCETGEIGVALTREAMLQACRSLSTRANTLWFCNIPRAEFLASTTADPNLFT